MNLRVIIFKGLIPVIFITTTFNTLELYLKNGLSEFLKNNKKSDSEGYIQNIQIEEVLDVVP